MSRVWLCLLLIVGGGVNGAGTAPKHGQDAPPALAVAAPPPSLRVAKSHPRRASRSRGVPGGTGTLLSTTCYLATGQRTASGVWPRPGMAAGNRWPLGTRLWVQRVGAVTIADRIGAHSDLDLFFTDRRACLRFGRHLLHVEVLR